MSPPDRPDNPVVLLPRPGSGDLGGNLGVDPLQSRRSRNLGLASLPARGDPPIVVRRRQPARRASEEVGDYGGRGGRIRIWTVTDREKKQKVWEDWAV